MPTTTDVMMMTMSMVVPERLVLGPPRAMPPDAPPLPLNIPVLVLFRPSDDDMVDQYVNSLVCVLVCAFVRVFV